MRGATRRVGRWLVLVGVLAMIGAACTQDVETDPSAVPAADPDQAGVADSAADPDQAGVADPAEPEFCDAATDAVLDRWAEVGFSGAVAFVADGGLGCSAGYGLADRGTGEPVTADTVFSIGSITKAFTAAAVLGLVEDGTLTLDERVGDVLAAVEGPIADATVEHLLTHAGGLRGNHGRDHEPLAFDEAIEAINGLDVVFEPGTDTLYSNAGYTLLAMIVETLSGTSYRDHVVERVLTLGDGETIGGFWDGEPAAARPRAVGYLDEVTTGVAGDFVGPHWALDGNGGLAMTPAALARWVQALLTGELLTPSSVETMTAPAFDLGDGTAEAMGWVSLDESLLGAPAFAASGGGGSIGHEMTVVAVPARGQVFAVASNGLDVRADQLLQSILPQLIEGEPIPAPSAGGAVDPAVAREVVGRYELEGPDGFEVSAAGQWIELGAVGPSALAALFPSPGFLDESAIGDHERLVAGFLSGETAAGRDELATFEAEFGPLEDVRIDGSVYQGEIRTFVTLTTASDTVPVWIALDAQGGLAGVEIFADPPTVRLGIGVGDEFRPLDLDGTDPDVTVSFDDATMTVVGPDGSVVANRRS